MEIHKTGQDCQAVSADKEVHRLSPGTSTLRGQRETELSVTESEKE